LELSVEDFVSPAISLKVFNILIDRRNRPIAAHLQL